MDSMEELDEFVDEWDRRRRMAAQLVYLVFCYHMSKYGIERSIRPNPQNRIQNRIREIRRVVLMHEIRTRKSSKDIIRMSPQAFETFCNMLRRSGLTDTRRSSVEEQVAKFLYTLGHNIRNRNVSFFFYRSFETTSRHFHRVLRVIISLEDQFLRQPDGYAVPSEILNNSRFFPYFKDCVGAIDGTHVRVKVPSTIAPRYRGRKSYPTQNVLATCSFDLKFTYVLPGWEGTASDSRIIKNALTREDNIRIPEGKYYLVDGGYMLKSTLITPYRGVRYHLKEYSKRGPENAKELFNLRHASLRNVIERCFGVLKKIFPIIGSTTDPSYSADTQTSIILACCILHNYLMGVDPDENILAEVDRELQNQVDEDEGGRDNNDTDAMKGAIIRDNITAAMWNDYVL